MNWLALDQFRALIPLPPGLRVESMRRADIAAVIVALRSWYPDVAHGSHSGYLRDEFYRQRVCLDGADDKDVQVFTIWAGDELVGVWSPEREVDSLALYARMGAIAPHHTGARLIRQITAGMEAVAREMGAAFMYAIVTLKHPYAAQALERGGYRLLGFWPGYDRQLVDGVVKRVYQAGFDPTRRTRRPGRGRCSSCSSRTERRARDPSVIVPRHKRAALAAQEVEVGAFVGLQHGVGVELPVA